MVVGEDTPEDKPIRAESAAGPDPPCPGQDTTDQVDVERKERPAALDTSDDEDDEAIERLSLEEGDPEVLHPEKAASSRPQSRLASSFANTDTVPRAQRRGLLGRFAVIPEVERPYEYKNRTKWMITAIVALAAAGAPMGSGIFLRK